jgi:hypothetical protein
MPDVLQRKFAQLDDVDPPDVWDDVISRQPRAVGPPLIRRSVAVVIALAVFTVGGVLVWTAFQPSAPRRPALAGTTTTTEPCGESTGRPVVTLTDEVLFDVSCVAVRANEPFLLEFRNDAAGGVQANLAIYEGSVGCEDPARCPPARDPLFRGELIAGGQTVVYDVPALAPGRYVVRDDVHPTVAAMLLVRAGAETSDSTGVRTIAEGTDPALGPWRLYVRTAESTEMWFQAGRAGTDVPLLRLPGPIRGVGLLRSADHPATVHGIVDGAVMGVDVLSNGERYQAKLTRLPDDLLEDASFFFAVIPERQPKDLSAELTGEVIAYDASGNELDRSSFGIDPAEIG